MNESREAVESAYRVDRSKWSALQRKRNLTRQEEAEMFREMGRHFQALERSGEQLLAPFWNPLGAAA